MNHENNSLDVAKELEESRLAKLVETYYTAIDANDLKTVLSLYDPTIVYIHGSQLIEGIRELEDFFRFKRNLKGTHEVLDIVVTPPKVIIKGHFSGSHSFYDRVANSFVETPIETDFEDVFEFLEGKIVRRWSFFAKSTPF